MRIVPSIHSFVFAIACALHPPCAHAQAGPSYHNPAWSPDGKSLTFESNRDGKSAIFKLRVADGSITRITNPASGSAQATWSRDGKRILFISDDDGLTALCTMRPDGTQRICFKGSEGALVPSYSPDGKWIVFQVEPRQKSVDYQVFVARANGSRLTALTDTMMTSESPSWSADGKRIYFQQAPALHARWGEVTPRVMRERNAKMKTMSMKLDGSDLHEDKLPAGALADGAHTPSPDRTLIAFTQKRDNKWGVYIARADGSGEKLVAGGDR